MGQRACMLQQGADRGLEEDCRCRYVHVRTPSARAARRPQAQPPTNVLTPLPPSRARITVHAKGSYIYLQLWALGRAAIEKDLKFDNSEFEVVSASDLAFEGGAKPRALSVEEIKEYVEWYAACAKAFVEEAGGDGVESESPLPWPCNATRSAADGSFLSPWFSQSTARTAT